MFPVKLSFLSYVRECFCVTIDKYDFFNTTIYSLKKTSILNFSTNVLQKYVCTLYYNCFFVKYVNIAVMSQDLIISFNYKIYICP